MPKANQPIDDLAHDRAMHLALYRHAKEPEKEEIKQYFIWSIQLEHLIEKKGFPVDTRKQVYSMMYATCFMLTEDIDSVQDCSNVLKVTYEFLSGNLEDTDIAKYSQFALTQSKTTQKRGQQLGLALSPLALLVLTFALAPILPELLVSILAATVFAYMIPLGAIIVISLLALFDNHRTVSRTMNNLCEKTPVAALIAARAQWMSPRLDGGRSSSANSPSLENKDDIDSETPLIAVQV